NISPFTKAARTYAEEVGYIKTEQSPLGIMTLDSEKRGPTHPTSKTPKHPAYGLSKAPSASVPARPFIPFISTQPSLRNHSENETASLHQRVFVLEKENQILRQKLARADQQGKEAEKNTKRMMQIYANTIEATRKWRAKRNGP